MGIITLPTTFVDNTVPTASQFNGDFQTIVNEFNGNISSSNVDSSIATADGTQTFTNKTLTKPIVNGSVQGLVTASDGATVTFDLSASNIQTVTLGGNRTLALSNATAGQVFTLRLKQDATGSRTVTWFSTINWSGGVTPVLTTTANKTDVFTFLCTSTGNYDGFVVGQNL